MNRLLTPGKLILIPLLFSYFTWAIPGQHLFLRGFAERAHANLGGLLLLTAFYSVVLLCAVGFASVGRGLVPSESAARARETDVEKRFYLIVTICSLVGVGAAYAAVGASISIVDALATSAANTLSENLADGSSLATFRYATALSAPIGVYLWRKRRASLSMAVINCLLLILNALLTSRLSLVMAIVVFCFLSAQDMPKMRIRAVTTVVWAAVFFAVFTLFNYVRNGNFYRLFGVENPVLMNVYQVLSYVGAPGQVSIGVASAIYNGEFRKVATFQTALEAITPTFWRQTKADKSAATDPALYGYSVDIAPNLNTNSAFADTYARYGWWGLVAVISAVCVVALLFGALSRIGGVYAAGAGVIGYGFAEFWRLFLFSQGILVFLIGLTITAAVLAAATTLSRKHLTSTSHIQDRKQH